MTDSRNIIEKADMAVSQMISDGGYLTPEQSDTFYRKLIDEPTLLNRVRTVQMGRPKMNIDKIGFAVSKFPSDGIEWHYVVGEVLKHFDRPLDL